jgi:hypothetical protein
VARQFFIPLALLSLVPTAIVILFMFAIDSPKPGAHQASQSPVEAQEAAPDES